MLFKKLEKILDFKSKKAEEEELAYSRKPSVLFYMLKGMVFWALKRRKKGKEQNIFNDIIWPSMRASIDLLHGIISFNFIIFLLFSQVQLFKKRLAVFFIPTIDWRQTVVVANSDGGNGWFISWNNAVVLVQKRSDF